MSEQAVKIIARPNPDPTRCDFEVDRPLFDGSAAFDDPAAAKGSVLAERLFTLSGVTAVAVKGSTVTVAKSGAVEWMTLAKQVGATIRGCLNEGVVLVAPAAATPPAPPKASPSDEVRIIARPQVDPTKCDFEVDRTVHDGVAWFPDAETASGSPLPEGIFAVGDIACVLLRGPIVTVTRTATAEWSQLARKIGAAIRGQLKTGAPAVAPGAGTSNLPNDDAAMRNRVAEVVEAEINPAVAAHGGFITVKDVRAGVVTIAMGGGCQGCSSSMATLKQGVETTLRARIPEIVAVVDGTNHSAGDNPYYN